MSRNTHLNVTVTGNLKEGVNHLTLAMVQVASQYGKVISGDYLEKKSLPGRKELFHIQYYTTRFECEHIYAPFFPDNIAKALPQSDAVIMMVNSDEGISLHQQAVLHLASEYGIDQLILFLNVHQDSMADFDAELLELAELEAQETLENFAINNVHILSGCLIQDATKVANSLIEIIDTHFQPRAYDIHTTSQMYIEKVYRVSDKGLRNAAVAYGFLRSGTLLSGMNLYVRGLTTDEPLVRVRSLEVFGEEAQRCEAGKSVAVLLERAPKNFPKPGQMLVGNQIEGEVAKQLALSLWVATESSDDPLMILGACQQLDMSYNMGKVTARLVDAQRELKENRILVTVMLEKSVAFLGKPAVLISTGENILGVGIIKAFVR